MEGHGHRGRQGAKSGARTGEDGRGIVASVLPHKVAHVTGGVAGREEAADVEGVKLQVRSWGRGDTLNICIFSRYFCLK